MEDGNQVNKFEDLTLDDGDGTIEEQKTTEYNTAVSDLETKGYQTGDIPEDKETETSELKNLEGETVTYWKEKEAGRTVNTCGKTLPF